MTTKEYLRTALQPYKSTKLIDIPLPNAPTSGATIEGDQRFPSVKDFAEYILKFGVAGKQAPTGNLWINGANLGAYEYYYSASSLSVTTMETAGVNTYSSADRNKCFFLVVNGSISLSPNLEFYTGSSTTNSKGKKLTCVYANGNISNGSLVNGSTFDYSSFSFDGSTSTSEIAEDVTIMSSPAGQYLYPRISKTAYPYDASANYISSASFASTEGNSPPSMLTPDADGKMYFGNGGSGMSASDGGVGSIGSAGFRATAFGGGGGGGGALSFTHYNYTGGTTVGGSSGLSIETGSKGGETITVVGGGGMPQGSTIDPAPTRINSQVSRVGGSGIIFAKGLMVNISIYSTGGSAPQNGNYPNPASFVGGGGAGGGIVFVMAQQELSSYSYGSTSSIANTNGGSGSIVTATKRGGNGGAGAIMKFYGAYF